MQLKVRLTELLRTLRSSYWFLPASLALLSIVASQVFISIDESFGASYFSNWDFLYANKPSGARVLLSTIAGSMIGVAGVAFSITIAAVAYASAQFGPRIIDNFMKDRGNQLTLGVFIANFLYCLLVLRIIRVGDDESTGFVPHISVFMAVLLALTSLGFLIFFLHHVPKSIHISKLVSNIGHEALTQADTIFPEEIGVDFDEERHEREVHFEENWSAPKFVRADRAGHIQIIECAGILNSEVDKLSKVELLVSPGEFVVEGQKIAQFEGDTAAEEQISKAFLIGDERSPSQDLLYLTDQMIDIAGRALSPGINDARTAKLCISWLHALLTKLGKKDFATSERVKLEHDKPVLKTKNPQFRDFVNSFYEQFRPYVKEDRNAAFHTLELSKTVQSDLIPVHRRSLFEATMRLITACRSSLTHPYDQKLLDQYQREITEINSVENQLETSTRVAAQTEKD